MLSAKCLLDEVIGRVSPRLPLVYAFTRDWNSVKKENEKGRGNKTR